VVVVVVIVVVVRSILQNDAMIIYDIYCNSIYTLVLYYVL
jgi:hypothetical protein